MASTEQPVRPGAGNPPTEEMRACLQAALESPELASSQRCRDFLRFVAEHSLSQDTSVLKESVIAGEVFARPDYDPAQDSFVRVKAADLRRRLGEYNKRTGSSAQWRIELPVGRYEVRFCRNSPEETVAEIAPEKLQPVTRFKFRLWWLLLPLVAVIGWTIFQSRPGSRVAPPQTRLSRIWKPAFQPGKPIIIFVPTPNAYLLRGSTVQRRKNGLALGPDARPGDVIPASDLVDFPDKVGLGAAHASVSLSLMFERFGQASEIKFGKELTLSDLRGGPAVILGAFSSTWSQELNNQYRFQLRRDPDSISDSQTPGREWAAEFRPDRWPVVDYAIAARIMHPMTKHYIFIAAGITTFGTQSAAEFLTGEDTLRELEARAPKGWEDKNFQVVLRTKVIGNSPTPPTLEAVHFW